MSNNNINEVLDDLVEKYMSKWKIKPSLLERYLKPGSKNFNNFLLKNKLSDVEGSDVVLKNIIENKGNMENNIMKFDKHRLFESVDYKIKDLKEVLYKGIEKAGIDMEKIIADNYDTNLSDIDIINSDKHIFRLNIWNDVTFVIVYSEEEYDIIKSNITEHLTDYLSNKKIKLINDISIDLNDILSGEKTQEKINKLLTEDLVKEIIGGLLGSYKFEAKIKEYYIWKFTK